MSDLWVFLTDSEPAPLQDGGLCLPARLLIEDRASPAAARSWFTAANRLGLALAVAGEPGQAAQLMELSIEISTRLAAADPDSIEFGAESCINRVDLLRRTDQAEAERAYRACYDLVLGRPVPKRYFFGLNIQALDTASGEITKRTLSVIRYRSQLGLLKLYLETGRRASAVEFAREVVSDFPRSVAAGMLHSAEVLAADNPGAPFLQIFNPVNPSTEGDFVILLRTIRHTPLSAAEAIATDIAQFEAAVGRFGHGKIFRNPRTPLLWSVYHASASRQPTQVLASRVERALRECVSCGDYQMYREIEKLARDYVSVPPFAVARHSAPVEDPLSLVGAFTAIGITLADARRAS